MKEQTEALRLAELVDHGSDSTLLEEEVAAELRRLHEHEVANDIWYKKTEWVQETARPGELGMHRADVLKQRIERLHSVNAELLESLKAMLKVWEEDPAYGAAHAEKARAAIARAEGEGKRTPSCTSECCCSISLCLRAPCI